MLRRYLHALAFSTAILASPLRLQAAPRDAAATKKIDEAINQHYAAMDFKTAEGLLLGVLQACEDKCSPAVVARAWMYVGVVRGAGRDDTAGAQEAFGRALAADPTAQLDAALTNPELQRLWQESQRNAQRADVVVRDQAVPTPPAPAAPEPAADVPGSMECSPRVTELQTRRLHPVACRTSEPAASAELIYKPFGSTQWERTDMRLENGSWFGEIPCNASALQGELTWYVRARGVEGDVVDNLGTPARPVSVHVTDSTPQPPPAFPGREPPARCRDVADCPEDMLGTPACPGTVKPAVRRGSAAFGDGCTATEECGSGLYCVDGTCSLAPSCEVDTDCASGHCESFTCRMAEPTAELAETNRDTHLNGLGLHFGYDLIMGPAATSVCDVAAGADEPGGYTCTQGGFRYPALDPSTTNDDRRILQDADVPGGPLDGTMRLLLSYERMVWRSLGVEGRLGFGFGGAPWGDLFLPLHLEGRAHWVFGNVSGRGASFRALLGVQGGVAQRDGSTTARVDDTLASDPDPLDGTTANSPNPCVGSMVPPATQNDAWENVACGLDGNTVEARKQLGAGFVGAHASARLLFGTTERVAWGAQLDLDLNYTISTNHFAFTPTVGAVFGF